MVVPIKSLPTLKVDARLLSVLLMILGVLWWYSLWLGITTAGFISGLHISWCVFFLGFLWSGPLMALGLLLIHARESRKHLYWVYPAVGIAVSPWLPVGLWYAWAFS